MNGLTITNPAVFFPSTNPPPRPSLPPLISLRRLPLSLPPRFSISTLAAVPDRSAAAEAAMVEVDMVRGRDGVYSARQQTVVVLWDLDNKPPRGPPYDAALSLLRLASFFGRVVEVSAYANRHAFLHLPQWVLEQRRDRRRLNVLERKGLSVPSDPYICGVCGRKCQTNLDLKKHFRQLHQRERNKKLARMRSLKGKRRQKYRERFISNNHKYDEAARELLTPQSGYGLASELRRAGVYVRTVADKPQAADAALKRQMQHSMTCGIDWMLLVSDDSDFTEMVRRARDAELRTVVIGDGRTALGRHADLWVPWMGVENGEFGEEVLTYARNAGLREERDNNNELFANATFMEDCDTSDLDNVIDEIVLRNSGARGVKISSAFSEEEILEGVGVQGHLVDGDVSDVESPLYDDGSDWESEEEDDGYKI